MMRAHIQPADDHAILRGLPSAPRTEGSHERLQNQRIDEVDAVKRLRVLVADDHKAMLDNLVRMLSRDFDVVAAVRDGEAVVTEAARVNPDVLVLDIAMPVLNGIAAAAQLLARGSTAKVVFVTMHHDREFVQESSALGTVGFVVKDRLVSDLMPAIQSVLAGQPFVSPTVRK